MSIGGVLAWMPFRKCAGAGDDGGRWKEIIDGASPDRERDHGSDCQIWSSDELPLPSDELPQFFEYATASYELSLASS